MQNLRNYKRAAWELLGSPDKENSELIDVLSSLCLLALSATSVYGGISELSRKAIDGDYYAGMQCQFGIVAGVACALAVVVPGSFIALRFNENLKRIEHENFRSAQAAAPQRPPLGTASTGTSETLKQ